VQEIWAVHVNVYTIHRRMQQRILGRPHDQHKCHMAL